MTDAEVTARSRGTSPELARRMARHSPNKPLPRTQQQLTFALSSLIGDLLNGVNPRDPRVYAAATFVLLAVTLFATYLPARRASRIDPQLALRAE